jgi:hypothetical protein
MPDGFFGDWNERVGKEIADSRVDSDLRVLGQDFTAQLRGN